MFTSKKELMAALKLTEEARHTEYPAFVEFACAGALEDGGRWSGKLCMRTVCPGLETRFYFDCDGHETQSVCVPYGLFKDAVKNLDGRECELVISSGVLTLWQGKDRMRIAGYDFGEEIRSCVPDFSFDPQSAVTRWLSVRELAAAADILRQLTWLPKAAGPGSEVYFENRVGPYEGLEDLVLCATDGYICGAGRVSVERFGGLGIFLVPGNAAGLLCKAHKCLCPNGCRLTLAGDMAVFDLGKWKLTARLAKKSFISPDIVTPRGVTAALDFEREYLLSAVRKAAWAAVKLHFVYEDGVLSLDVGDGKNWSTAAACAAGRERPAQERRFEFEVAAARLLKVLKKVSAPRVRLYCGENALLYAAAGNVHFVIMTDKNPAKQPATEGEKNA